MKAHISVLMPVYNCAQFVEAAVNSILRQTLKHFILYIIDDGSTDGSYDLVAKLASNDERIILQHNETNLGIIATRNQLLKKINTEFAAWMDADDIALPTRLEEQHKYLNEHQNLSACTCHYKVFGDRTESVNVANDAVSRENLLFFNYVLNPGAMFRSDLVKQHGIKFRDWLSGASDYLFWVELAAIKPLGVVSKVLMHYRTHGNQETAAQSTRQLTGCAEICRYQLNKLGVNTVSVEQLLMFLIYPADAMKLKYDKQTMLNAIDLYQQITHATQISDLNYKKVEGLLFQLVRAHSKRTGLIGFRIFVQTFGLQGLARCDYFGGKLLWQSIFK
ncbi:MAG: glycosyltransferase family 2 protein [Paraglaciecola sp.]|nr:glycosyltransferase family 2 protein [Paraglaciecola sp.]